MYETNSIFSCGHANPVFLITFSVADEEKTYSVCKSCEDIGYFKKFVIKKVSIESVVTDTAPITDAKAGGS
jgi:hypothetical protein